MVALPVLPAGQTDAGLLLGPGADELVERTGLDLLGACEVAKATGRAGEVNCVAVPGGSTSCVTCAVYRPVSSLPSTRNTSLPMLTVEPLSSCVTGPF